MRNIILHIEGGIGKHIAATAVVEAIKKKYLNDKLIVLCSYPEIFINNPLIYRVYKTSICQYFYDDFIKDREKDTILLSGEVYNSHQYVVQNKHIIQSWCEMFSLEYNGELPALFLTQPELIDAFNKFKRNKPTLILQTNGGFESLKYNWARDLEPNLTNDIINKIKDQYHIFHIKREDQFYYENTEPICAQNLREIFCLISLSSKRLFIDSFCQHAAAALGMPSTVCWIGTSPNKLGYTLHSNIIPSDNSKIFAHNLEGIITETEFIGLNHQCNLNLSNIFNKEEIISSLL